MKKKLLYLMLILLLVAVSFANWHYSKQEDPLAVKPLPELPVPPLKELAERKGLQLGSFAALKYLRERSYSEILASEFEYAIIDGEPNWHFEDFTLRSGKDRFDFRRFDQVFDFADENNMPVRVQHLLWGEEKWLPGWLKKGDLSREELFSLAENHIKTVGERYKGRVREYSVVNEAFSRELKTGGNEDWWGKKLGREYIDRAFIWARAADPNAKLILNDFANETEGEISNNMYLYIKDAKSRGIPIDGVGMQMHIDASNAPSKEKVVSNMRRFAELGVKVYITEFDVNIHAVVGDEEAKFARQAEIYSDMMGACLEVGPEVCPNFGFLGLIDRQSWYQGIGIDDGMPLMFNDDYTPKPAFFAVRSALEK